MKDEQARRDAEMALRREAKLRAEVAELRADASRWVVDLQRRVSDLAKRRDFYEKDCPECKRKTLMKQTFIPNPTAPNDGWWVHVPRFYCYSCGKTFKEVETKALVEVTG